MTQEDSQPMRASPRPPEARDAREARDDRMRIEELTAALEEARAAVRSRDELLAIVTHDLGNPLTAIVMSASAIPREDAQAARGADVILRCTERMARLLDDLADVTTSIVGKDGAAALRMARTDPRSVVRDTSEMFEALAADRGLAFTTTCVDEMVPSALLCDRDRVVQALGNLVANALKVTKRGGRVTLGLDAERDAILFWVEDTGPGIDGDELPRIFDPHWRGKRATYGGRGLGLWIARAIADAHGGRLSVASTPPRGSRFTLALPR